MTIGSRENELTWNFTEGMLLEEKGIDLWVLKNLFSGLSFIGLLFLLFALTISPNSDYSCGGVGIFFSSSLSGMEKGSRK